MSILDTIVEAKRLEVLERRGRHSERELIRSAAGFDRSSLEAALRKEGIDVIAEVKYSSPSHGPFVCQAPPDEVATAYAAAGAAAISVLTDRPFFEGRPEFLTQAYEGLRDHQLESIPLLQKDFILERYQVAEAAAWGASAFLLIVACLPASLLRELIDYGRDQGLEALVEVHDEFEIDAAVSTGASIIGVNNRDLTTFETSLDVSFRLARMLEGEDSVTLVSESGLSEPSQLLELSEAGFAAFLIGGSLMDTPAPGQSLARVLDELGTGTEAGP